MGAQRTLEQLSASRRSLATLQLPNAPGVYAVYLADPASLGLSVEGSAPCYVGRTSDLARRGMHQHLKPAASGSSTLRRSLGALLRESLGLNPVHRGQGQKSRDYTNYRFDDVSEAALSDWMDRNVEIGFVETASHKAVEQSIIDEFPPPMNLAGCTGSHVERLKALRAACTEAARRAAGV